MFGLDAFIARQIARRTPAHPVPLRVSPRRLYILPTRFGGVFVILMLALLAGATNYGNNLAFALAFWLGAVALVSMHRAHRNLAGIMLLRCDTPPVHAGETLVHHLVCASRARRARRTVAIGPADNDAPAGRYDIDDETTITITDTARQRGRQGLGSLRIESRYPLGLFRCWARLAPVHEAVVYPRPGGRSLAERIATRTAETEARPTVIEGDEYRGHRRYRDGDELRQVDWKQSARRDHWLVRETGGQEPLADLIFDYAELVDLNREDRLSQLTRWVIEADAAGRAYRLILPHDDQGPASGPAHRGRCLEALALAP